jgi:hypothetical protein
LSNISPTLQDDLGAIASNNFGEHYLFAVNRNLFQGTDASTVFRSYYGETLFEEDCFYIIAGTDSGLLYQYVKAHGIPKGSRYLFLEIPEILSLLEIADENQDELVVTAEEDWLKVADGMQINKYACMSRLTLFRSLGVIHGHYSPYAQFWREIKKAFDAYLTNSRMMLQIRPFVTAQIMNLAENQVSATCLLNTFNGKTAVILAGGPSLDSLIPWVKKNRNNLLVIAVSRIGRALQDAGLSPDIFVSVDPQEHNLFVSKDMLAFQEESTLVYNYHLSPNLLASWSGSKAFIGPRYPWSTPLQPEFIPPGGGATVTNSSMELALNMGAAQIILCGADFCFNQEGFTHASGTAEKNIGPMPQLCQLQVETNSGRMADTENSYLQSSQYIDLQAEIAKKKGCRVINPSPDSMRLQHVEYIPVDDIQIEELDQPAKEIIRKNMPADEKNLRLKIYKEVLGEVDRILDELRKIKELASKGLEYNKKVYVSENIDSKIAHKINRLEEQLNGKYSETINFIKTYDISRFTDIYRLEMAELEDKIKNNQIFFQALIDTSNELDEILHDARMRTVNRIEEENPQPSIRNLLNQWQHDKQVGRAVQWVQHHQDSVKSLPEKLKNELVEFIDSFDKSIEESGKSYIAKIKHETELNGIIARAREQFLCHDKEGLYRIIASLKQHKDQAKAANFVHLVEGYIAELNNDFDAAIKSYSSISEELAQLDALMRLFEIYTTRQDWENALAVLEALASISPTYIPMYADMLQATGDTEAAVGIYTEYLLNNPDDLDSMMRLGRLFLKEGVVDGIKWTMGYILEKDPENQEAKKILNEASLAL